MEIHHVFLASSIVDFARRRMQLGNWVRLLNDITVPAHGLYTRLFICEDADERIRAEGMQNYYNEHIPGSELFILLMQGSHLGKYTREEAAVAAQAARDGRLSRILVGLNRTESDTLPPALDALADSAAVVCFDDITALQTAILQELRALDARYPRQINLG